MLPLEKPPGWCIEVRKRHYGGWMSSKNADTEIGSTAPQSCPVRWSKTSYLHAQWSRQDTMRHMSGDGYKDVTAESKTRFSENVKRINCPAINPETEEDVLAWILLTTELPYLTTGWYTWYCINRSEAQLIAAQNWSTSSCVLIGNRRICPRITGGD